MLVRKRIPPNEAWWRVPCCERFDVHVVEGLDNPIFLVFLSVVLRLTVTAALLMLGCCSFLWSWWFFVSCCFCFLFASLALWKLLLSVVLLLVVSDYILFGGPFLDALRWGLLSGGGYSLGDVAWSPVWSPRVCGVSLAVPVSTVFYLSFFLYFYGGARLVFCTDGGFSFFHTHFSVAWLPLSSIPVVAWRLYVMRGSIRSKFLLRSGHFVCLRCSWALTALSDSSAFMCFLTYTYVGRQCHGFWIKGFVIWVLLRFISRYLTFSVSFSKQPTWRVPNTCCYI